MSHGAGTSRGGGATGAPWAGTTPPPSTMRTSRVSRACPAVSLPAPGARAEERLRARKMQMQSAESRPRACACICVCGCVGGPTAVRLQYGRRPYGPSAEGRAACVVGPPPAHGKQLGRRACIGAWGSFPGSTIMFTWLTCCAAHTRGAVRRPFPCRRPPCAALGNSHGEPNQNPLRKIPRS